MADLILTLLRLIFLALVYLFVWQVARSIGSHLGLGGGGRRRRAGNRVVFVRSETQSGLDVVVTDAVVFGRSPDADVLIEDPYASEFHLRLQARDGKLLLSDLGSTNGTYVNGRRVTVPVELRVGDAVQVGKTVMEVR